MNIAFITPRMIVGGAEQYIISKSRFLLKKGHHVIVISQGGSNIASLPKSVKHYTLKKEFDINMLHLSSKREKEIILNISNILIADNIDIIEVHNTYPVYYAFWISYYTRIPVLYNLLNELSYKFKDLIIFDLVRIFNRKRLYFTLTSTMNNYVESRICEKLNPHLLPIPVDELPKYEISDGSFILTVCRFSYDKMYVLNLIKGFADAYSNQRIPSDMKLIIVGDGEKRKKVIEVVKNANQRCGAEQVKVLGTIVGDELYKLYASCSVYVGMGTTIIQAAQYKKAIVKVGFEKQMDKWAWGFWGNDIEKDRNKIVATNESSCNRISFSDILFYCFENREELEVLGQKAYQIYKEYYMHDEILNSWESCYLKILQEKPCFNLSDCERIKKDAFKMRIVYFIIRQLIEIKRYFNRIKRYNS